MIVPLALAALVARCAPAVGPLTMNAVLVYESGARPNAIGDNTAHAAYFPASRAQAARIARGLVAAGHSIDVGYAQLNSANFARFGLDPGSALEPCRNVAAGATILREAYARAVRRDGPGQLALAHALSAYNTGGFYAGLGYARGVYETAATLRVARAPR